MLEFIQKIIEFFFGKKYDKDIKEVMPLVSKIKAAHEGMDALSVDELRNKTVQFKARIAEFLSEIDEDINGIKTRIKDDPDMDPDVKEELYEEIDKLEKERDQELEVVLEEILPEAFAVVKETATRFSDNETLTSTATQLDRDLSVTHDFLTIDGDQATYKNSWIAAGGEVQWNMIHYDVQLIGGIVLHQGRIAEMATGEGKTLVATLPAYLNALAGNGVHIVTVNNYLAKRDSEWMAPILNFLGLTVDCIDKHQPNTARRREAYLADITYGTNNEFGFDYLRDNMVRTPNELVQRKKHYAMIDEVDSVLIDDARTPLIISGPVERGDEHQFDILKPRIERLMNEQRNLIRGYLSDAKKRIAEGKSGVEEGEGGLDLLRAFRGLPKNKRLIKYLSEPGIKQLLLATENHYLQEQSKRMPDVDKELYFVIEEKNNQVNLTEKGVELITSTGEESDFFVMTDIGEIMSEIENDTESTEEEKVKQKDEALKEFSIKSERLHSVQQLLKAYTLFEKEVEYVVMDGQVKIVDESTGRIMDGRRYSDGLHQAIEAKESVKVEAATQTFATVTLQNFFRMYHKLAGMTGTAETEAGEFWEIYKLDVVVIPTNRPIARADSEDLVFRTEREKFKAVTEETIRLSKEGRPVLVGTTSVENSELLSNVLKRNGINHNVLNAKNHAREADIVAIAGRTFTNDKGEVLGNVTIATNMAGRGTDIKLSDAVKEAGGLAIIGTERHDSRRVDRQLRGRSGRQGDPGSSQFFVSLEDKLMRLFASDRIAKVMDRIGFEEGEVIQHSMITKSIERAQKKVEENNFGIRKRLLDYDEVMNVQRNSVYAKRKHALFGERLTVDLYNGFADLSLDLVEVHKETDDYETFKQDVMRTFAMNVPMEEEEFRSQSVDDLANSLYRHASESYKRKSQQIIQNAMPVLHRIYEEQGQTVERIVVPFTDGVRPINVIVNLQDAIDSKGRALIKAFEKSISLASIDDAWKLHLRQMDELKNDVQTASYEQKDPLLIYKQEAYNLFKIMALDLNREVSAFLFRGNLPAPDPERVQQAQAPRKTDMSKMQTSRPSNEEGGKKLSTNSKESSKPQTVKRTTPKVGRNDTCPCGSGKKYKNCHGKKQQVS